MADPYEDIVRTGPGTPMGELMRQYWIPAARSTELEADGAPVRILLLGEKLIAFRDTSGRVGVMDHRCPHRCASLFLGRNEENGIRCVYHGWKYDVDGNCVDQANLPERQQFKDRIRAKAYLTAERNGVVWVYMGDPAKAPALPPFDACLAPADLIQLRFVQRHCNWLQAVEGDLDTSHVGILHFGAASPTQTQNNSRRDLIINRAPEYRVTETQFGLTYGAHRPSPTLPGGTYWRGSRISFSRSGSCRRSRASSRTSWCAPSSRWMTSIACSSASNRNPISAPMTTGSGSRALMCAIMSIPTPPAGTGAIAWSNARRMII